MEQIIGTIVKSDNTVARISLSDYKGKDYVNIREWYTKDRQTWYPSNKGIAFETKHIGDLVTLTEKAEEAIMQGVSNGSNQGDIS